MDSPYRCYDGIIYEGEFDTMSSKRGTRSGRKKEPYETEGEKAARLQRELQESLKEKEMKEREEAKQRNKQRYALRLARRKKATEKVYRQEVSHDRLVLPYDPRLTVKGPTNIVRKVHPIIDFDRGAILAETMLMTTALGVRSKSKEQ